jgi:hypothetical protein
MDNLAALCFRSTKPLSTDQLNEIDTNGLYKYSSAQPVIPPNCIQQRRRSSAQQSSLLSTMERFVQSVDEMNETILVPCRLMDLEYTAVHDGVGAGGGIDPYTFYNTLNSVKSVLLCGRDQHPQVNPQANGGSVPGNGEVKGHARKASTTSNSSRGGSENDFPLQDCDSGVEEEYCQQLSDSFHMHLNGLDKCLRQMTTVAEGITLKYTQDVGGGI